MAHVPEPSLTEKLAVRGLLAGEMSAMFSDDRLKIGSEGRASLPSAIDRSPALQAARRYRWWSPPTRDSEMTWPVPLGSSRARPPEQGRLLRQLRSRGRTSFRSSSCAFDGMPEAYCRARNPKRPSNSQSNEPRVRAIVEERRFGGLRKRASKPWRPAGWSAGRDQDPQLSLLVLF